MKLFARFALIFLSFAFISCSNPKDKKLIIWTNNTEFVSYVELFNATHENTKAVVVYKKEPARALPPSKDELPPDIVAGPWLKNSLTRKYFTSVDYLFSEKSISKTQFYKKLLNYGSINEKQYLLPVSFNIPVMIFSKKNESLVGTNHYLSFNRIMEYGSKFNAKNEKGVFTAMGFAPSWNSEFLYTLTKLNGTSYREKGTSFLWNEEAMKNSIKQIIDWTSSCNTDTTTEQNFQFRYLYMPFYRQVTTGRCLFAYTTSDRLFTLTDAQGSHISFRWIMEDNKIPVEDNIITMGIYKKAENSEQAETFISWFLKEETQQKLIERTENMKLDTVNFGIAGGFSSIRDVNEKYYPAFYRQLLGNMPAEEFLTLPNILPYRWESLKSNVILPYLLDSTNTNGAKNNSTLEERITEWTKQFY
ncbi:MAG: hypothetical protein SPJ89_06405 [Treponema sp.]|nr:extracellular solute-binding protein [Spirochaetales bacterium]MDY5811592.1 hypothetical protein [Treponema sp.]